LPVKPKKVMIIALKSEHAFSVKLGTFYFLN
jgi:hypothetical protein